MQISAPSFETIGVLVGTVGLLRIVQAYLDFRRVRRTIGNLPGYRTILDSMALLVNFSPPLPGLSLGYNHIWRAKHSSDSYSRRALDQISLWPKVKVRLIIADAQAIRKIVWARGRFPKPLHQYKALASFGNNIVVSEGVEWRRYRKIVAPAFSDRNNRLAWEETTQIMLDLFNSTWEGQDTITYDHGVDLTLPISLFVIGAAGFGRRISWKDDVVIPVGHRLTFKDALHSVTKNLKTKLLIPRWTMGLTKRWRHTRLAFDELQQYLLEMIDKRRNAEKKEEHHVLFNSLILASDNEEISGDDVKLSDSELMGNIFMFLMAGHETMAHSLCFAFAMLALVFFEALRMFPPVTFIPKASSEDTSIVTMDVNGEKRTVHIPQGTSATLDVAGLHYNPRYWEDPHTFKPSRFLGDWNRDAFLPFSGGYRVCVGRKFAETEGTAVLTLLVSHFKIEIKEESQFAAESFEQRKARVLNARSIITLGPIHAPLVFKRRV
ncbi:cytochrome P450 [Hygrophoropsis aurantiaca]|uniref:Cytochrome P450 n=1 Tax=Hygrophoropsis aurantiaca TaxID=72124 RepID=A0ACB8A8J9_9AGAM|nr:cytochrome P450 [Hygrophoropsis aurantiaca]